MARLVILALGVGALGVLPAGLALSACSGSETTDTKGGPGDPDGGVRVILDGGGDPAESPNGVPLCPKGVCNYESGEGCSDPTPSCTPAKDGAGQPVASCQPVLKAGGNGAFCSQFSDCAPGYICAGKACHKLCCGGDWSQCPSG